MAKVIDTIGGTNLFRVLTGLCAIALLVLSVWGVFRLAELRPEADLAYGFTGILIVVMVALGALAILFAAGRLSQHPEAFGLPSGSIRALLAIGLMVLFVAFGMHQLRVLNAMSERAPQKIAEVSIPAADVERELERLKGMGLIALRQAGAGNGQVGLKILRPADRAPPEFVDLAKQLVTIIGTLLTTVVGFYFGTRAVSERDGERRPRGAPAGTDGKGGDVGTSRTRLAEAQRRLAGYQAEIEALGTRPELAENPTARAQLDALKAAVTKPAETITEIDKRITAAEAAAKAAIDSPETARDSQAQAASALQEADARLAELEEALAGLGSQLESLHKIVPEG